MDNILNDDMVKAHNYLEESFRSGFSKFKEGSNQMALSLYNMQRFFTWRVAIDDQGDTFLNWTSYVEWLADDVGLSRSTMWSYKSAIEFARSNMFSVDEDGDLDPDKFIERGGVLTFRRIKKSTVTDRTGKIVSIKGFEVENPAEIIETVVNGIDPDGRPMDQVKYIKETILDQVGEEDNIEIGLRLLPSEEGGYNLIWTKESSVGLEQGLVSYPVPQDVLTELKSEFHIHE